MQPVISTRNASCRDNRTEASASPRFPDNRLPFRRQETQARQVCKSTAAPTSKIAKPADHVDADIAIGHCQRCMPRISPIQRQDQCAQRTTGCGSWSFIRPRSGRFIVISAFDQVDFDCMRRVLGNQCNMSGIFGAASRRKLTGQRRVHGSALFVSETFVGPRSC